MEYLLFRRGRRWYAAPVDRSFEVLEISSPTRVPGASAPVQGVIAHRGEVVPLIDLATDAPEPPEGSGKARRAVLLRSSGGPLALSVSEVAGLVKVEPPSVEMGESGLEGCFRGPALLEGCEVSVLDPERLYTFLCRAVLPADGRMR